MLKQYDKETIFAYALALDQSGRQKSIVLGFENVIYILNSDKTIVLRFETTDNRPLKDPITFWANDYDSPNFNINNERIVFVQKGEDWIRSKMCKAPNITFSEVEDMFFKFYNPDVFQFYFTAHKSMVELLETNLSHMEFVVADKEIKILQRDIFSGSIIELKKSTQAGGLGIMVVEDKLPKKLPIIGMRTNDFLALFYFNDKIKTFIPEEQGYFIIEGMHNSMIGVIAGCLYDDIGVIRNLQEEDDGRKEQENRNGIKTVDRQAQGQVMRRRCKS